MVKEPLRTCKICGRKVVKHRLDRYVLRNNMPFIDKLATMSGRGAYCCRNEQCTMRFLNEKKRWNRAFRVKL